MTEYVETSTAASFPNILAVVDYLKTRGWKAGKSIVYQHRNGGKIRPRADGLFYQKDVDKYAKTFLRRVETGQTVTRDLDDIHEKKARAEQEKSEHQAALLAIKRKAAEGTYVDKGYFDRELGRRAAIFRLDQEGFIRSKASDMTALVEGNPALIPVLIDYLLTEMEIILARYSEERPIEVPVGADSVDDELDAVDDSADEDED